jgi:hypothetical protein
VIERQIWALDLPGSAETVFLQKIKKTWLASVRLAADACARGRAFASIRLTADALAAGARTPKMGARASGPKFFF